MCGSNTDLDLQHCRDLCNQCGGSGRLLTGSGSDLGVRIRIFNNKIGIILNSTVSFSFLLFVLLLVLVSSSSSSSYYYYRVPILLLLVLLLLLLILLLLVVLPPPSCPLLLLLVLYYCFSAFTTGTISLPTTPTSATPPRPHPRPPTRAKIRIVSFTLFSCSASDHHSTW